MLRASALLVLTSAVATASTIDHTGYLLGVNDQPLDGTPTFTFRLLDGAGAGASELWTGTCSAPVQAGYYHAALGSSPCGSAIDSASLAGTPYLEVAVNGVTLSPRHALRATPTADLAHDAERLGGLLPTAFAAASHNHAGTYLTPADGANFANVAHTHDASALTSGTVPLARLPTGAGSGLSADTLDGFDSSAFAPASIGGDLTDAKNRLTYSPDCTDFASKGWASRQDCLSDGRWHKLGSYTGGTGAPVADIALAQTLVEQGADVKIQFLSPSPYRTMWPVWYILPSCNGTSSICFYMHKPVAGTLRTNALYLRNDSQNGNFWMGSGSDGTFSGFNSGSSSEVATGTTSFNVFVRL